MELLDESEYTKSFKQENEIARGHFGVVYKVIEIKTEKARAAKIIKCRRKKDSDKVVMMFSFVYKHISFFFTVISREFFKAIFHTLNLSQVLLFLVFSYL